MSGDEKMEAYEKRLREVISIPANQISGSGKMHIEGIGEVHIAGSGFVSPEEIRISGAGSLPGGLKVQKIRGAGEVSIGGDVEAEDIEFSGEASVKGNITTKTLTVAGSLIAHGQIRADLVKSAGSCKVGKGIDLRDTLRACGSLRVFGDVKATNAVALHGKFDVGGKVNTKTFEAKLCRSESHVNGGIQSVNVDVKKGKAEGMVILGVPILRRFFPYEGRLHTTDIVAEETVDVENVSCGSVQGRDVAIGKGCIVNGKVQYSNSISVHPSAKIVNPPEKTPKG
jgi:cytoskeletal protein CcmA (bactofilin family)